ncbi:hypothetical protein CBL_13770 [Carabus blaptoides fortunei]
MTHTPNVACASAILKPGAFSLRNTSHLSTGVGGKHVILPIFQVKARPCVCVCMVARLCPLYTTHSLGLNVAEMTESGVFGYRNEKRLGAPANTDTRRTRLPT